MRDHIGYMNLILVYIGHYRATLGQTRTYLQRLPDLVMHLVHAVVDMDVESQMRGKKQ